MPLLLAAAALLCLGDSITAGGQPGIERPWCEQLGGENIGVGLTTTESWLEAFDTDVVPHLAPNQTVHVLLGANDAIRQSRGRGEYSRNLRELIRRLQGEGRRVVLSPQYLLDLEYFFGNALVRVYAEEVQAIWEQGLAERGAPLLARRPELQDGLHPSQHGHDQIAAMLRPLLLPDEPQSRSRWPGWLLAGALALVATGIWRRRARDRAGTSA